MGCLQPGTILYLVSLFSKGRQWHVRSYNINHVFHIFYIPVSPLHHIVQVTVRNDLDHNWLLLASGLRKLLFVWEHTAVVKLVCSGFMGGEWVSERERVLYLSVLTRHWSLSLINDLDCYRCKAVDIRIHLERRMRRRKKKNKKMDGWREGWEDEEGGGERNRP